MRRTPDIDTLTAELELLREERRTIARENRGAFKEDQHGALDRTIAEARETLDHVVCL